jgi:hypothetical protein
MARTIVNVADRGVDDSGTRPVNDVLAAAHGSDRKLYFPPGRYRLNPITLAGSNWALVGEDATLVVPGHVRRTWLSARGSDWEIDGFTVDLRAEGAAPSTYLSGTDWEFRNVAFRGTMGDPGYGQPGEEGGLVYPAVPEPGATGLLENVEMGDGSAAIGEASNRTGIWFGENNRGELTLRGLRMAKWAHNTLYAEASAGPVTIEDSVFRRTNVGVRVGGDTVVRNCVFVQDDGVPIQAWSGGASGRGLWLNANSHYPGPILVENCDFTMTGEAAGDAIANENDVDHLTVRNCTFRLAGDRKAIDLARGQNSVTVNGVDVTGEAAPPAIQVSGGGTATDVCAPHGYDDVRGLSATDVRWDDCLQPRTGVGRGLDETFANLRIAARAEPNYEFIVDGTVRPGPEADVEDVITHRDDGTTTVAGFVGFGRADDYYVRGTVTDFRFVHTDPTVELDGHPVDLAEQPWELRPRERVEGERERTGEAVDDERTEGTVDERTEGAEREDDEERTEPGRRPALPRYAGGGRVWRERPVRGPGGEWSS